MGGSKRDRARGPLHTYKLRLFMYVCMSIRACIQVLYILVTKVMYVVEGSHLYYVRMICVFIYVSAVHS